MWGHGDCPRRNRQYTRASMSHPDSGGWTSLVSVGGLASLGGAALLWWLGNEEAARAGRINGLACHEKLDGEQQQQQQQQQQREATRGGPAAQLLTRAPIPCMKTCASFKAFSHCWWL
jgi:hypothetical protein